MPWNCSSRRRDAEVDVRTADARPSGTAPQVTALRSRGHDRVEVDLDGSPWRVMPVQAAAEAGLTVGRVLDRERARALGRALRRHHAHVAALRALRFADHSRAGLDARLAGRGVAPAARAEAVERVTRAGLVDDERFAHGRAGSLARRGLGDAAILADLETRGVAEVVARNAVAELEPEEHRARAIVRARGASARTARYLAARGFGEDAVEATIAAAFDDGLG
jgi:regulatory protein